MPLKSIVLDYVLHALRRADVNKLPGGTYSARVPDCIGAVAYGESPQEALAELKSVLDDWVRVGIAEGHYIPVIDGIDLNTEENRRLAAY